MKMPNIESVIEDHSTPNALDPCEDFVEATKLYRSTMGIDLPNISRLDRVKELLAASSYATKAWPTQCRIPLDHPCLDEASTMTLSLALRDRVSSKKIEPGTRLSFGDLSYLLWAADGMTHELDNGSTGRTAPSGGALYPRDVYLITRDDAIEKIPRGAWHYNPYEHCLEQVGDQGLEQVFNHQWHREVVENAAACFLVAGVFWRNRFKYNRRGVRFAHLEAGMVTQNFLLAATSLSLQPLPFGGYFDDELADSCGLDGLHETPLSVVFLGGRRKTES